MFCEEPLIELPRRFGIGMRPAKRFQREAGVSKNVEDLIEANDLLGFGDQASTLLAIANR